MGLNSYIIANARPLMRWMRRNNIRSKTMKFAICDDEAKHLSRVIEAANEYINGFYVDYNGVWQRP